MFTISSILWPSDGSAFSLKALETVVAIAEKFSARIYVLRVVRQVPPIVQGTGFVAPMNIKGFDTSLYQYELLSVAEKDLSQIVSEKVPREIEAIQKVEIGNPADVISRFAEENGIDVIVMASHGQSGLSGFLIGSVAEKVIRRSSTLTWIIPALSDDN